MAPLWEYFEKQNPSNLMLHEDWAFSSDGKPVATVRARLHFDLEARGFFASFYFPASDENVSLVRAALSRLPTLLQMHRAPTHHLSAVNGIDPPLAPAENRRGRK